MLNHLQDQAIAAALKQDWDIAINLNLTYLNGSPNHIPTLNRLAKAYKEVGDIDQAIKTYENVLNLDKYNVIALKNLAILKKNPPHVGHRHPECRISTEFIKEPGKSKTFHLTRLGDPKIVSNLLPGEVVRIIPKKHTICLYTDQNEHIGALTDDVAFELKQCLQSGIIFEAVIKSVSNQKVVVFLREITNGHNVTLKFLI